MKKKQKVALLALMMTMGSTLPVMASVVTTSTQTAKPEFTSINSDDFYKNHAQNSDKLIERHQILTDTIYNKAFENLTLGEKISLISDYFQSKTDIYQEDQSLIMTISDSIKLEAIKTRLIHDSDNQNKDLKYLSMIVNELQTESVANLSKNDKIQMKEQAIKLIQSYQNIRSTGRNLEILISNKEKMINSSELRMFSKYGKQNVNEEDKEAVLDNQLKQLKLTNGSKVEYKKAVELLKSQNKEFFFVNNNVVELTSPFIKKNDSTYLEVSHLNRVEGFTVTGDASSVIIQEGENTLEINKVDKSAQYNGVFIGSDIALIEGEKIYVPLRVTFEMFNYDVKKDNTISTILIDKQIYEENEVDKIEASQFVSNLLK